MQVFIYCKYILHVSGVHRTHHQEYMKLYLQPPVQIIVTVQNPSSNVTYLGHIRGRVLHCYYDLYRRLQVQFHVLLMMGTMDTRNM